MIILVRWRCLECKQTHTTAPGEKCKRCPHCQADGSKLEIAK